MASKLWAVVAIAVASVSAHPELLSRQLSEAWSPPGDGDVRSPCPGLNTLANHGLLPHNGRGITIDMAVAAFKTGFNVGADVITIASQNTLNLCADRGCKSFDLDLLNTPHAIEHDASLTREDYNAGAGNNHDFNAGIWQQTLDLWGDCSIVDFSRANAARIMRINAVKKTDAPGWFQENDGGSLTEHSFYLSAMGDPVNGNARKDWIDYWFRNQRLPFELGYTPPASENNQGKIDAMIGKITGAGDTPGPCLGSTSSSSSSSSSSTSSSTSISSSASASTSLTASTASTSASVSESTSIASSSSVSVPTTATTMSTISSSSSSSMLPPYGNFSASSIILSTLSSASTQTTEVKPITSSAITQTTEVKSITSSGSTQTTEIKPITSSGITPTTKVETFTKTELTTVVYPTSTYVPTTIIITTALTTTTCPYQSLNPYTQIIPPSVWSAIESSPASATISIVKPGTTVYETSVLITAISSIQAITTQGQSTEVVVPAATGTTTTRASTATSPPPALFTGNTASHIHGDASAAALFGGVIIAFMGMVY